MDISTGPGQQADVPVQGGLGDVGQAGAQVRGGEYPPAGHGVHDAQPHRVQEQVKCLHHATIPYLVLFPKLGKQGGSQRCRTSRRGATPPAP